MYIRAETKRVKQKIRTPDIRVLKTITKTGKLIQYIHRKEIQYTRRS